MNHRISPEPDKPETNTKGKELQMGTNNSLLL
jgi:hypothetical protein